MFAYLFIIFFSMALISVVNIFFTINAFGMTIFSVISTVFIASFIVFLIDAVVAFIIHKMPNKWFNPYKKIYHVFEFERNFYESIGIKKWKDRIPEMGQLCDFKKDKIVDINNNDYIFKFLEETCYAETLHLLSAFLGVAVILFFPIKYAFWITGPVAVVNFFLQILPVFIQRYTRPKLMKIYERNILISKISQSIN
ncbi:MAG: hypothetical protein GX756_04140 [Clostridiales bacterium]|nr:hypothetical protein [Clostridiales bacterium]